ncbi:hypothetical protein HG537_0B06820 [Torulaspora globosa]|uniref:VASt domain-containing protein n=1 Tax=Torulaspora globosa TaxID=48254 RepID=A0A7H9HNI2_9SACH|nr:hypothetical protein HG537_0B06820 [Torulaspora sp. CBS 2947]
MSSSSAIDNWVPVADERVEDDEVMLTHRKQTDGGSGNDGDVMETLGEPFSPEVVNGTGDMRMLPAEAAKTRYERDSVRRKSGSSLEAVGLNMKSSPASPHLSDVNSVSSTASTGASKSRALSSVNDIITNSDKDLLKAGSKPGDDQSASAASNFFDNVMSSLSFKPGTQQTLEAERTQNIPDIITHRRQASTSNKKNARKTSSPVDSESPLKEVEKPKEVIRKVSLNDNEAFDPKRFVEEKFLDTPFHYANAERNSEFHALFKNVPPEDRLLDDFGCALSREFLYQGRIYVSESHLCFSSSLLGWIAKVVTPFKDITYMEKTSTAGLFPNAISIETEKGKTQFNGFISRDNAFSLLKEVWSRALLAQGENENSGGSPGADHHSIDNGLGSRYTDLVRATGPPSRTSFVSENDSIIEDAIRSVDDYTSFQYLNDENASGEDDDDEYDEDFDEISQKDRSGLSEEKIGYRLKPKADYTYDGPYYGRETTFPYKPEDNNETVLAEVELDAPPGLVFQLIFSETNPSFWHEFFKSQDSSQFSHIGRFDQANQEGQHFREFTYAKGLHFPVGPKSTRCIVQETILHLDYTDYINVLNITKTPDVPSGGSFSTRTRYMLRWASETTSILQISYWVEWTASSWIKSMVESSCKSGQIAATKDFVELIKKYVADNTEKGPVTVYLASSKSSSRRKAPARAAAVTSASESKIKIPTEQSPVPLLQQSSGQNAYVVPLLVAIIVLLCFNLLYLIKMTGNMNKIRDCILLQAVGGKQAKWPGGSNLLMDIPAKNLDRRGRLASGLQRWFGHAKALNNTHSEKDVLQQFLSSLEALILENSDRSN